jgi:hypothetical protein
MSKRFAYAIDKRYLPLLVPFGLRGSKDGVTLTDEGSLSATFGFFKIKTPLANVTEAHITRNYRWWTAFGVRGSMVDDGLSFGTNHNAGVWVHFAEKVPSPLRRSGQLGAHRDRGGPRRVDQRLGGRARRNIQCLPALSRAGRRPGASFAE